ncbi:MAG TPA: electron transport complex subunit RsxA [Dehalococcoidia bacterium]|nr:electron transport complex subunit RsxA [Dehalococcoidia bacterium]
MGELWSIFIGMALINNIILVKFLGLCPFFGISKKLGIAVNMGVLVTAVMLVASVAGWLIDNYVLAPLNAEYLNIIMYILVIATLVQMIEVFLKRTNYSLYNSFGIYLALIVTNCAVLGIILISNDEGYSFIESLIAALGAGIGFTLVLAIMSGIRERLELADCPRALKGLPIAFITGALLVMAFYGFTGIV